MAQLNKTDDFFKSKLYNAEIEPSIEAWAQVQKTIGESTKPWYAGLGKIAAAVALVVTTIFIFNSTKKEEQWLADVVDHPVLIPNKTFEIIVPEIVKNTQLVKNEISVQNQKPKKKTIELIHNAPTKTLEKDLIATLEIEKIEPELISIELEERLPILKESKNNSGPKPVKITYIAASENPEPDQPIEKFSRVVEAAQHVSPSELLADLRDAKNNLFGLNGSGMSRLNRN